jgi:putative dimethyl sulfoxide reductase chaperone
MTTISAQVQAQAQSRAAIYGFLAWLFLEQPDADFVTRLLENEVQEHINSLSSKIPPDSRMLDGLQRMRLSLLNGESRTPEDLCRTLAVEHTRLMRGIGSNYGPPPPYESLYRAAESGDDHACLLQLTEFYHRAQVAIPVDDAERVDYLGVELDLMRLLCEEECRSLEQGNTMEARNYSALQQHFLDEHMLAWAPRFCASFIAHTPKGFYHGVALFLLGFLEAEAAIAAEQPDETPEFTGNTG